MPTDTRPSSLDETSLALHPLRGIKRCVLVSLLFAMILFVMWIGWRTIARRRLREAVDAIRARHEPIDSADFVSALVPPEQNAVPLWQAAAAAIPANIDCPSSSNLSFPDRLPLPPAWHRMENAAIVADAKSLELARQASTLPGVDWGPGAATNFMILNTTRALANVLGDAAQHAHIHGDDAEAIRRIDNILQQADAVAHIGSVVGYLTAAGQQALAYDRLDHILPEMEIRDGSASAHGPASRSQVVNLIASLADENECKAQLLRAVYYERYARRTAVDTMRQRAVALGPMLDRSENRMLESYEMDIRAFEQTDSAKMTAIFASAGIQALPTTNSPSWWGQYRLSRFADVQIDWPMERFFETNWKSIAERRTSEVAVAIRLYRLDHNHYPEQLRELVPAYLPAVPTDPFVPGDLPIGYVILKHALPDGADRPLLYFGFAGDPFVANVPSGPSYTWNYNSDVTMDTSGHAKQVRIIGQWRDLSQWLPPPLPPVPPGFPPGIPPRQ